MPMYILAVKPVTVSEELELKHEHFPLLREVYNTAEKTVTLYDDDDGVVVRVKHIHAPDRGVDAFIPAGARCCSLLSSPGVSSLSLLFPEAKRNGDGVSMRHLLLRDDSAITIFPGSVTTSALMQALHARLSRDMERAANVKRLHWIWSTTTLATSLRLQKEEAALRATLFPREAVFRAALVPAAADVVADVDVFALAAAAAAAGVRQNGAAIYFADGKRFDALTLHKLSKHELGLLQIVHNIASKTGGCLEVFIDMHGEIDISEEPVRALLCVKLIRSAPTGCLAFEGADGNDRKMYIEEFHRARETDEFPAFLYEMQNSYYPVEQSYLDHASPRDREWASRTARFLQRQAERGERGEHCKAVSCSADQLFFNKKYTPSGPFSITLLNAGENMENVDLFPLMLQCRYSCGYNATNRSRIFDFFLALGATSLTLVDHSCAVLTTDVAEILTEAEEAAFLRKYPTALGGR